MMMGGMVFYPDPSDQITIVDDVYMEPSQAHVDSTVWVGVETRR